MQLLQERHNLVRRAGVQVTRGLVGQDDYRRGDEGTGYGHALLLTAAELGRGVAHTLVESHTVDGLHGHLAPLAGAIGTVIHQGQLHILEHRCAGQQVVALEHKAYLAVAYVGQLVAAQGTHIDAVDAVGARGGTVEAPQYIEQRTLAAATGAHDAHNIALLDAKADTPQGMHRFAANNEVAPQVFYLDDIHWVSVSALADPYACRPAGCYPCPLPSSGGKCCAPPARPLQGLWWL